MADHITEEEQIESLKRWWAENGKGIVTGVVLALAGYFGYQWWQNAERSEAEAASGIYRSFVEAVSSNDNQPDETQFTTAKSLADQLKGDYAKRIYASQASLRLAALAVQRNDLESAEKELQWVLDNSGETELKLLAKRRLAAVKAGRGELDEALQLLGGNVPTAFAALYAETRGDILLQKGDKGAARTAYEQALAQLLPGQQSNRGLLEMKIEALPAAEEAETENSQTEQQPAQDSAQESDAQ